MRMQIAATACLMRSRPASHWCVLAIFGFTTTAFVLLLIKENSGKHERSVWDSPMMAFMFLLGAAAFLALLIGRERKFGFYVTAVCLAAWTLRGIQSSIYGLLAYLADPNAFAQSPMPYHITTPAMVFLMAVLFVRFSFGQPSRAYFGFVPASSL